MDEAKPEPQDFRARATRRAVDFRPPAPHALIMNAATPAPGPATPVHPARVVALTGASGFIGRFCAPALAREGRALVLLQRTITPGQTAAIAGARLVETGDLSLIGGGAGKEPGANLIETLRGCDALVHLAGRAHRAIGDEAEALALYRAHNTAPTLALARAAAAAGVRHMVFASTSYVHGHVTRPGQPFSSDSPLAPSGAYALSKAEAETGLRRLAPELGLAVSIVRPAVVHGPHPTANIRALLGAVRRGLPLPFASIDNRRSFLGLENLTAFIAHALDNPPPAGAVAAWTLADAQTPSTPDFVRLLGAAAGRHPRLVPFPPALLRRALTLAGRGGMAESLIDSFEIDMRPVLARSGWAPPLTLAEGLRRMATADA